MKTVRYILLCLSATAAWAACREPYATPGLKVNANYLVVDGFLNAGDSTTITLTRTRNLGDSVPPAPEENAQVTVLGDAGELYPLYAAGDGKYTALTLPLNPAKKYQLQILTSDGRKYLSDSIAVSLTPAIDSISWKQDTTSASNKLGVTIYASTHDPLNSTHYYRWDYLETWQYHTSYDSYFYYSGSQVLARPGNEHVYYCWKSAPSTSLILASSASLAQDLIYETPVNFIPLGDQRLSVKYSILVKQYSLSREAYEYWQSLKKNTELTGSIFDPQPSSSTGNLHCVTDPNEPVLGFLSASTVQQQRIFIDSRDISAWGFISVPTDCVEVIVPPDSLAYFFNNKRYIPTRQQPPPAAGYFGASSACVDCTLQGGSAVKPSYWQ